MAKRIFKYPLETVGIQEIEMPQGAEILCIQTQNDKPCIWALVEPNETVTKRTFEIFVTGYDIIEDANRKYIGTYQLHNERLISHCFELVSLF